jgi:hypothetical protein
MFNVGDEVRVIPGKSPKHGMGDVYYDDIGIITAIVNGYYVDFPRHPQWKARLNDLELVNREPDWEV